MPPSLPLLFALGPLRFSDSSSPTRLRRSPFCSACFLRPPYTPQLNKATRSPISQYRATRQGGHSRYSLTPLRRPPDFYIYILTKLPPIWCMLGDIARYRGDVAPSKNTNRPRAHIKKSPYGHRHFNLTYAFRRIRSLWPKISPNAERGKRSRIRRA